jgi:flavorubredoxin
LCAREAVVVVFVVVRVSSGRPEELDDREEETVFGSSSTKRGISPKIRPSFFEVRTRTLRSRDERVFEVGGGGGNAIARGYDEVILVCLILDVGGIYLDG